jgi:hypothetical protein
MASIDELLKKVDAANPQITSQSSIDDLLSKVDAYSSAPPSLPGATLPAEEMPKIEESEVYRRFKAADPAFRGLSEDTVRQLISEFSEDGEITLFAMGDLERKAKLEQIRNKNPYLAQTIEDMGGMEKLAVGFQYGLRSIPQGLGITDRPTGIEAEAKRGLLETSKAAGLGYAGGQTAPFMAGMAGAARLPVQGPLKKAIAPAVIGGLEGGTIASAEGGTTGEIAMSTGLGFLLGAGGEVAAPFIRRVSGRVASELKGEPYKLSELIDVEGNPTAKLQEVANQAGIDLEKEIITEMSNAGPMAQELAKEATRATPRLEQVAEKIQPSPERMKAAEELGLEDVPAPVLSQDQAVQEIGGALAAVPGSIASEELDAFAMQLGMKADDIITELGGSTDKLYASDKLMESISSKQQSLFDDAEDLYTKVRSKVPQGVKVDTAPLTGLIEMEAKDLGGVKNLKGATKYIYNTLKDTGVRTGQLLEPEKKLKTTYAVLDRERKEIGAALRKQRSREVYQNATEAELSTLYSRLTQLQEGVAKQYGADDLWSKAKALTSERKALEEQSVKLFGSEMSSPAAMTKLMNGLKGISNRNYKGFIETIKLIPEQDRGEFMASALNGVFTGSQAENRAFTASQFTKWMNELKRSTAAYKLVDEALPPGGMDRLNSLHEISKGMTGVTKNRVKTGVVKAMLDDFDKTNGIAAKVYNLADKVDRLPVVSQTARVVSNLARMASKEQTPAVESVDRLLASNQFKSMMNQVAIDPNGAKARAAQEAVKRTQVYKKFLESIHPTDAAQITASGLIGFLTGLAIDKPITSSAAAEGSRS